MTDKLLESIATGGPIAILFALFLLVLSRWLLPIVEKFIAATTRITDVAEQCLAALRENTRVMEKLGGKLDHAANGRTPNQ